MQTIRIECDARGVATLWLARPDKHNALSAQMIQELTGAAGILGGDPAVRAVVLGGHGASFCAGGDLDWMREQMRSGTAMRRQAARDLAMMLKALNELPKPLIGRVQGNAFGGGIGLISVCDVAVAVPDARFGLTETRLGLIPATIGPYVLARMGEGKARRVFMSGRLFDAPEAMALDLIAATAPPEALDRAVQAQVVPYLACAPGAVARAKRLARQLGPPIDAARIEASIDALVDAWDGAEAAEGIAAFFDMRRPGWHSA